MGSGASWEEIERTLTVAEQVDARCGEGDARLRQSRILEIIFVAACLGSMTLVSSSTRAGMIGMMLTASIALLVLVAVELILKDSRRRLEADRRTLNELVTLVRGAEQGDGLSEVAKQLVRIRMGRLGSA